MEIAHQAVTEKKAAEMCKDQLSSARKLLEELATGSVSLAPTSSFITALDKVSNFVEVASNLDADQEKQSEMYQLLEEIKETCDEHFGPGVMSKFYEFLDKQWPKGSEGLGLQFSDSDVEVLDNTKVRGLWFRVCAFFSFV